MCLRGQVRLFTALIAVVGLSACGSAVDEPIAHSGSAVVKGEQPSVVYAKIARLVRMCWFKPSAPVLSKHIFYAKAPADGGSASIIIFEKSSQKKRGLQAYSIEFNKRIKATQIETTNRRLPYALAQKLSADVNRWSQGNDTCQSFSQSAGGASPGSRTSVSPALGRAGQ